MHSFFDEKKEKRIIHETHNYGDRTYTAHNFSISFKRGKGEFCDMFKVTAYIDNERIAISYDELLPSVYIHEKSFKEFSEALDRSAKEFIELIITHYNFGETLYRMAELLQQALSGPLKNLFKKTEEIPAPLQIFTHDIQHTEPNTTSEPKETSTIIADNTVSNKSKEEKKKEKADYLSKQAEQRLFSRTMYQIGESVRSQGKIILYFNERHMTRDQMNEWTRELSQLSRERVCWSYYKVYDEKYIAIHASGNMDAIYSCAKQLLPKLNNYIQETSNERGVELAGHLFTESDLDYTREENDFFSRELKKYS